MLMAESARKMQKSVFLILKMLPNTNEHGSSTDFLQLKFKDNCGTKALISNMLKIKPGKLVFEKIVV